MTSIETYKNFLLKLNRNDTSSNLNVPIEDFVIMFNEQAIKWVKREKEDDDGFIDFSVCLVPDTALEKISESENYDKFKVPSNFLKNVSIYALASKDLVKNRPMAVWIMKPKNSNLITFDINNGPSFEYEETPAKYVEDSLIVYKSDFSLDNVYLTYYRTPKKIDIKGYINMIGEQSTNIDPEFSDEETFRIIDKVVTEVQRNTSKIEEYKLSETRNI